MTKSDPVLSPLRLPEEFHGTLWMAAFTSLLGASALLLVNHSSPSNDSSLTLIYNKLTHPDGVSSGDHRMMFNAAISMDHAGTANVLAVFILIVALGVLGLTVRDVVNARGSTRCLIPFIIAVAILVGTGATTAILTSRAHELATQYLRSIDDQNSRNTLAAVAKMRDIWTFVRVAAFLQPLLILGVVSWANRRARTDLTPPSNTA